MCEKTEMPKIDNGIDSIFFGGGHFDYEGIDTHDMICMRHSFCECFN